MIDLGYAPLFKRSNMETIGELLEEDRKSHKPPSYMLRRDGRNDLVYSHTVASNDVNVVYYTTVQDSSTWTNATTS